ncbi:ATP-binding protein [Bradyrhizobium sp. LHD-71]|uniref:sensor histidine kinase n=1 Tax=Bradyrhizobium sp. LHD-71 TaxID=3072141 RepID=UPI00280FE94F|nr:ATP-binding protein [Bradyrhizobium sp. LHD-71]MDQ8728242.1 ATP-binding protein [Bradyrhizobium sp. LHD-71]
MQKRQTAAFVLLALLLVLAGSFSAQRLWRESGLRALQAINEPRIQVVANVVRAEISRQDHLPSVLSFDPDVQRALAAPLDTALRDKLNDKLARVSREADTRALYVISPSGEIFAGDDPAGLDTRAGRDLSGRPYLRSAMETGRGTFLGIDQASNRASYYIARSVGSAPVLGVAVVRIEFDGIEAGWVRAGERVLITDASGTVFLSSDPSFKYRQLDAAAHHRPEGTERSAYPNRYKKPIDFERVESRGDGQVVRVRTPQGEHSYLYQAMPLEDYGWTIHRLSDLATIESDERDGAIIGAAISVIVVSALLYLRQRHAALVAARKASAELSSIVAERTRELREANVALRSEVEERRRTEARLRDTQNSLVQAGKLAALGQMSAAIAHEINQPLAAIRTFVASTKVYSSRGDTSRVAGNLDLINGLAERMANITSHLKTFARKSEPGRAETLDVERAVRGAMLLIESQIGLSRTTIETSVPHGLFIRGHTVQLEQVIVNLLQNATHAVAGVAKPVINLCVSATNNVVSIKIADNGGGIPREHLDQIFDPFFTTKAIGKGLGLGLSISYGIVRDFDGEIRARNREEGGTEMIIELPRYHPENALLHA